MKETKEDRLELIKFLKFIGLQSIDLENQINNSNFAITYIILSMTATKLGETTDTILNWFEKFKKDKPTELSK